MQHLLYNAIEYHYSQLLERNKRVSRTGIELEESYNELLNRLSDEKHKLERNGNYESFVYSLYFYIERVKDQKPPIQSNSVLNYALALFEEERGKSSINGEQVVLWCSRPIEEIADELGKYLAYNKAIDTLKKMVFSDYPIVSEIEALADNDDAYQYLQDYEANKSESIIADTSYVESEDKSSISPMENSIEPAKIKEDELLKEVEDAFKIVAANKDKIIETLYESLNEIHIKNIDKETFSNHFNGKIVEPKINWDSFLYQLIYLLDRLDPYCSKLMYSKVYKSARFEPTSNHFLVNGEPLNKHSWEQTRSNNKDKTEHHDPEIKKIEEILRKIQKVM